MNAAILCPGPSLAEMWNGDFEGLIIGVNRAAVAYSCDWWAFGDPEIFREWYPKNHPRIFASHHAVYGADGLLTEPGFWQFCPLLHDDVEFPNRDGWQTFTATAALVLAHHLGATDISVYGCDRTNAPDFDGVNISPDGRHEERWRRETKIWEAVTNEMAQVGVTIHGRH